MSHPTWKQLQSKVQPALPMLIRQRSIQGSAPFQAWLRFVDASLPAINAQRRRWRDWAEYMLLASIVGGLVLVFFRWWLLVAVAGIIACIAYLIRRRFRWNLSFPHNDQRFSTYFRPLINMLAEDIHPQQTVGGYLDLHASDRPDTRLHEDRSKDRLVRTYQHTWLMLSFRLLNGAKLRLQITDHSRLRSATIRKRSGKPRYKSKIKIKRTINVIRLLLPHEQLDTHAVQIMSNDQFMFQFRADQQRLVVQHRFQVNPEQDQLGPILQTIGAAVNAIHSKENTV